MLSSRFIELLDPLNLVRIRYTASTTGVKMGSLNATIAWTPPPLSSLKISHCEPATDWAAEYIRALRKNKTLIDVPMPLMNNYLLSMIPQNGTRPSESDLTLWSLDLFGKSREYAGKPEYDRWFNSTLYEPIVRCNHTICKKLDWGGDPDVSGIGVKFIRPFQSVLCPY